jgi:hypothetical protein
MNGYTQIEFKGKLRGIKFGMLAVQQIMLAASKLNAELGNEIDIALIPEVLYWGLYNCSINKREIIDYTFEDVAEYVDDHIHDKEIFVQIMICFYDSKIIKASLPQAEQKEEKKSSI